MRNLLNRLKKISNKWDVSPINIVREAFASCAVVDLGHARKHLARESGDPMTAFARKGTEAASEVRGCKPMMRGHGKSDSLIVPRKPPNKAQATEEVEGRRLAKGDLLEQNILRTQSQVGMHSALEWVRKADCYSLALSL